MKSFKKDCLLVIAPHPDDEVIGCGGLISRVKEDGGKVFLLFLTVGSTKDYSKRGFTKLDERVVEIKKVVKFLSIDDYHIAFPGEEYHLRLDKIPQRDIIAEIENAKVSLHKSNPTIVAFPSIYSYNQDHRIAAQASFSATRPMPKEFKPLTPLVLSYEEPTDAWTPHESPSPNFFVTLTEDNLKAKITALKLYKTQLREGNHPRSPKALETLARLRGAQSGQTLSEAFYCYRIIL